MDGGFDPKRDLTYANREPYFDMISNQLGLLMIVVLFQFSSFRLHVHVDLCCHLKLPRIPQFCDIRLGPLD